MHEKLRRKLFASWARLICRRPVLILTLAVLAAAASVWVTLDRLTFQGDRNALITPDLDWNQRFERWRASFPGTTDLYAVIDAGAGGLADHPPRHDEAQLAAADLADRLTALKEQGLVEDFVWRFTPDQFSTRAIRLLPMAEFASRLEQIDQAELILNSPTPDALLDGIVAEVRTRTSGQAVRDPQAFNRAQSRADGARADSATQQGDTDLEAAREAATLLSVFLNAMATTIEQPPQQRPTFSTMLQAGIEPPQYLQSENGRLYFLRITPNVQTGAINALERSIEAIRHAVVEVDITYTDLAMGLTGIEVIEADETAQATRDSTIASIVAVVVIGILLVAAFHSWRTPLLAIVSLLVGIAWSFGYLTLVVGHLQILSIIFTVILMGLGIAYGIHLASRFEMVRHRYRDTPNGFELSLRDSFATAGPGIVTGAVTTAAAFLTTLFTDFTGMAEMGLIASGGIMLCLLSMFSVFPALLRLVKPGHSDFIPMQARAFHLFEERWVSPFTHRPRTTLAAAAVLTLFSLAGASQLRFDYDLMKLYPDDMSSVEWQRRITRDGDESVWTGTLIAKDLVEARKLTELLRGQPMVAQVRGIGLLFPPQEANKIELLAPARESLGPRLDQILADSDSTLNQKADPDVLSSKLTVLNLVAGFFASSVPPELRPTVDQLTGEIARVVEKLNELTPPERQRRADILLSEYRTWRRDFARDIAAALDGRPLLPADLPKALLAPYIADRGPLKGQLALEVVPKIPDTGDYSGPLDRRFLPQFVEMLESIDDQATGVIAQIYHSGFLIERSYMLAGLYALGAVYGLMLFDFQSFRDAALCLVPVAIGFTVTFAVMWLIGMSVNFANIMVLPLMFGIGVDAGVHVLHRHRQDPTGRPPGLTLGTGKGITVTSFTAIIGFGTLMFAGHKGIASLGFVMTLGIALTMLACWTILPAWLTWQTWRHEVSDAQADAGIIND